MHKGSIRLTCLRSILLALCSTCGGEEHSASTPKLSDRLRVLRRGALTFSTST